MKAILSLAVNLSKLGLIYEDIQCVFGLAFAALRFSFYVFSFFFFFFTRFPPHKRLLFMYCTWTVAATFDQFYVNSASVHCSRTHKFHFLSIFSLKMGPTVLFTHLKIFLLQCFQFSVFSFSKISSIQTHPQCLVASLRSFFPSCVRRSANSVTHFLARYACHIDDNVV